MQLLISCEHAVNRIPKTYAPYFVDAQPLLNTHYGVDFGAMHVAKKLAQALSCPLFLATTSRLLIEYNRSLHHPRCFSEVTKTLSPLMKKDIIDRYYMPYRNHILTAVQEGIKQAHVVLHLSIHSFTPELHGKKRNNDIGLLYDPKRTGEYNLARLWKAYLSPYGYRVRMNYPYLGTGDGLVTALRKQFSQSQYLGFEIEINQKHVFNRSYMMELTQHLTACLLDSQ
jgi:predicted N-formylglutamate amidohydrolase